MDADAIVSDLVHEGIINRGDESSIVKTEDPERQNQCLHRILKQKCTPDAFRIVCDLVINLKGNPKMNALGEAMKKRIDTGVCKHACI